MVKAGNMMWNDIVNANCARANTTASQPSNMTSIRRLLQMEPYHTRPADGIAATANREIVRLIISPGNVPVSRHGGARKCETTRRGITGSFAVGRQRMLVEYSTRASGGQAVNASHAQELGELFAGIKHAGLHRALGDADDPADLFHGFLVIIHEVDDLAMCGGQFRYTGAQDGAGAAAIQRGFRRIGLIGDL